jgi:diacylglycerol kinase (ATP)
VSAYKDRVTTSSPRTHLLLIANRNASGLASAPEKLDAVRRLLERAGASVEERLTDSVEEMEAALATDGDRRVALLGGDGTLHAAANAPGPRPELALVPAGGANNIARSFGIPLDLPSAAAVAVDGVARPLDGILAKNDGRRYIAVEGVSVGFLAVARSLYRAKNSMDVRAAVRAGAVALRSFHPFCVRVEGGMGVERMQVSQLFIANLPLYAFGLRVAPLADPADGFADLTAIDAKTRPQLLAALARLRRRPEVSCPGYRCWREQSVRVSAGDRSPVIADSTDLGYGNVELTVEPATLSVVLPRR